MDDRYFTFIKNLSSDLSNQIARRAWVLERIGAFQPVGRRLLAQRLNIPEREIRTLATALKEDELLTLDVSGMRLTEKGMELLPMAQLFCKELNKISELENNLAKLFNIPKVCIVSGNSDETEHTLVEMGKSMAVQLRSYLHNGSILAVSGGKSLLSVLQAISTQKMNIMVVPAKGNRGYLLETQSNTIACEMARKLGGHSRFLQLPEQINQSTLIEMRKQPDIEEPFSLLERADLLLHGIGNVSGVSLAPTAVAEVCGSYFNKDGKIVHADVVSQNVGKLKPKCQFIAIAGGEKKATAIKAVLKSRPYALLVTDEAAAKAILQTN